MDSSKEFLMYRPAAKFPSWVKRSTKRRSAQTRDQRLKPLSTDPVTCTNSIIKLRSPLPTGPFFGTTTSQKAFAPFKIMQQRSPTRIEQATQSHFHNCDRDLHTHQFTMVSSKLQPSVTSAAIMKLNVLHQCTRRCGNRS